MLKRLVMKIAGLRYCVVRRGTKPGDVLLLQDVLRKVIVYTSLIILGFIGLVVYAKYLLGL